jgi:hypothetical protein
MKRLLILSLITVNAHAGFWCPEKPNEVRFPKPHDGCFEVADDFDTETAEVVNGLLVVSASKVADKEAREATREAVKAAKRQKILDCDAILADTDKANNVADLKEVVKCLVEHVR